MRKMKVIFVILLCAYTAIAHSYATANDDNGTTSNQVVILNPKTKPNRPKVPIRYFIQCTYGSGYLDFVIPESVEYLTVSVESDGTSVCSRVVTPVEHCIDLPLTSGTYELICTTNTGFIFTGVIDL